MTEREEQGERAGLLLWLQFPEALSVGMGEGPPSHPCGHPVALVPPPQTLGDCKSPQEG